MPNWSKVARNRAENARKAMELLENTANSTYEFTPEEGLELISGLQDALDNLKLAYKDRLPENSGFATAGDTLNKDELMALASPVIAVEAGKEPRYPEDPEVLAITNSRNPASAGGHVVNTRSDEQLVIPMWTQIKEFVAAVPNNQLPAYILHIGGRMYEDAYEMVKK